MQHKRLERDRAGGDLRRELVTFWVIGGLACLAILALVLAVINGPLP